jgi:C4-dicarboxylate transporter DctM subunit
MTIDPLAGFLAFLVVLIAFMATGVPIAVGMGIIGSIGTAVFVSPAAVAQVASIAYSQSGNFVLAVVPMFVLMGDVLASTPIGRDLFRAAQLLLRRLPGSLAVATVFACAAFGSVCGSSPVTAATIGRMSVPEMRRRGYDNRLALGATAAGGTLGILIPPSISMIIYGILTDTSIGKLFIAGIIPGLMLACLLAATIIFKVHRNPALAPHKTEDATSGATRRALLPLWPVALLGFLVLGSMYGGLATPTEASAVGAAGAIAIAWLRRHLTWRILRDAFDSTVRTTAMFTLLLLGGLFVSFVMARLGIPQGMSEVLRGAALPGWAVIVLICVLLIILGCFMDPTSIMVVMVPILFPSIVALGYDPIWFGVMVTILIEIAAITPPVGFNLFVLKSVVPDTKLYDVTAGSLIFVMPLAFGLIVLLIFPEIALVLPRLAR